MSKSRTIENAVAILDFYIVKASKAPSRIGNITMSMRSEIDIQIAKSINEIDADEWNNLSAGLPFQSHTWYAFGERAMSDCEPMYLLAYLHGKLLGRGCFWVIRNEPLPQYAGKWRLVLKPLLQKWPLLICRSPLSYTSGLVLPEDTVMRKEVIGLFVNTALAQGYQKRCSFLLLDFLSEKANDQWPADLWVVGMPGPGTVMHNRWQDFDDYLAHGNKKDRQHYKRTVREAEKLHITIKRDVHLEVGGEILALIQNVERQHGAPSNPWTINMIQNMEMVKGTLLIATVNEKMIGCGLLLEDNNAQMASALGLSGDVPYVYLMLVYEGIKIALEHKLNLLRWGSGAYDVKQRLGFIHEDNSLSAFTPIYPLTRKLSGWLARQNRRNAS